MLNIITIIVSKITSHYVDTVQMREEKWEELWFSDVWIVLFHLESNRIEYWIIIRNFESNRIVFAILKSRDVKFVFS